MQAKGSLLLKADLRDETQGWEGWLAPATRPTLHLIPCKRYYKSQGWEGWLVPAPLPKRSLNTVEPPFPTLRSGEVLQEYLSDLLGEAAGASHPS